ncbi:MAG: ComEC/Rec2 family competence protein [Phycisphaerae bacterium]|nr:ComEC/Rec2 family competence protein [Phycisphaerae bacterium]
MDTSGTGHLRPRQLIRAPLVPVAIALACGIAAGCYLALPATAWGVAAGAASLAAVAALAAGRFDALAAGCLLVAVATGGALLADLRARHVAADSVVTYTPRGASQLSTLRGTIVTAPAIQAPGKDVAFGYRPSKQTSFVLRATAIRTSDRWRAVSGKVRVRVREPAWRLAAGQRVELAGWLRRPRPPANPGARDWASVDRNRGLHTHLSVPGADGVTICAGATQSPVARAIWHVRAAARQHLADCGDQRSRPILTALVVGERSGALASMSRTMRRVGVAHLLSISGLHLGIFLGFIYVLCRLAALPPRRAAVAVLVVLTVYVLLATPRAPLLRSAIMGASLCAAVLLRRRLSVLNALALAAIVLLVLDPMRLFRAGFQLSFAIVTGIILLYRPMRGALFGRFLQRRGLLVFRGDQRVARWMHYTVADRLMDLVAVSLTAYLVAAPLVAYHFGLFSPYAPLLSIVLLPLVAAVLVPGYLSLALAWPMPNLAYAVGRIAAAAADVLAGAVGLIERLPGASLPLRPVPAVWVVGVFAVIVLVASHRRLPRGRAWAIAGVILLAGVTAWTQRPAATPPAAELHLLHVGAGQCAVLHTPDGQTILLDAGTQSGYDAGRATLLPFLRDQRLPAPRIAIVSHANTDHFNALAPLVPGFGERADARVERVYLNAYFGLGGDGDRAEGPAAGEFLRQLDAAGVDVRRLAAGDRLDLDTRTRVEVLWPRRGRSGELAADANETSLVLRITCDGRRVLLTGDLGPVGQQALLDDAALRGKLRCDVLVVPHHGGWAQTLPVFVEAVAPEVVLISGSHETHVPPGVAPDRRAFYSRLRTHYRYYHTARDGWVATRFGAGGIRVRSMR